MWLAVLAQLASAQECPPAALALAIQRIGEIKAAYVNVDIQAFDAGATELAGLVRCIDDPLTPQMAVEIHHVMGLRAFANQDEMGAQRSLSAVRELAPEWRPNEATIEPESPLHRFYAMELPAEEIPLAARPPGGWLVDGEGGAFVPGHRAFVLQAIGRRGQIVYSGYHTSPTTLPAFDFPTGQTRRNVRIFGTIGSGAVLAGALATEVLAAGARGRADEAGLSGVERLTLLERSQTLQTVAIGLGVFGASGAVVTWAVPW